MFGDMDEGLKKFVSDYNINVVIPQEIEDFGKFRTSLGAVLEMIRVSEDEKEMERLLQVNERYSHMDNESVAAINTFTGVGISVATEKGETDMCKAWADHKEAGRKEGSEKERMTAIRNMIDLGVPEEKILTKYTVEDYERARSSQFMQV